MNLNTDSFYKFTTTLSLIATIYFFSFSELYLRPHNEYMSKTNIDRAQLSSEYGYLRGRSEDLTAIIKDSVQNGYIEYFYFNAKDTSDIYKYYSSINLSLENKQKVDSLNLINKALSTVHFKMEAMDGTNKVYESNLRVKSWISYILGFMFLLCFLFSLYKWYVNRNSIDK